MRLSFHRLGDRLLLRILMPTVVAVGLVAAGLYFFVLRSVSMFADEQIRESLIDLASGVYNICDENFTALMQSGKMDDARAVRIKKAFTLGAIEEYVSRGNAGCRLWIGGNQELLRTRMDADLLQAIAGFSDPIPAFTFDYRGKTFYFHRIVFKPWDWHVDLVKDAQAYALLISRVKAIYIVTGELLLGGLVLLLLLQDRLFRRPLNRIIGPVQKGQAPDYNGIYEFEFLSDSIAAMMRSLEERNQWIERLYQIAIAHRGQDYFKHLADALSEALDAGILIVAAGPVANGFHPIAGSRQRAFDDPSDVIRALPIQQIVDEKQAVVVSVEDEERTPMARFLPAGRGCYAGVPIISRESSVIGAINVFASQTTLDEWRLNFIKTACQMVAVELAFSAEEKDRLRLEAQLQKSQKMEAIGTLAGGVAHDLNNILSGIVSYPDLLLLDLPADSPLRRPILSIKQSGERAAIIVQDLLTLARRGVAVSEVVNLNTIIAEQLKRPEFEKLQSFHPQVAVTTRFDPQLMNIKGSVTHLAKSVMNLISNAAEAMPSGGDIVIATENRTIERPLSGHDPVRPGDYAMVTISDTGIGISDQDKDRIFEPFYTKKVMGRSGTGLGMAVVWGTIQDHDGYIHLDSTEGRGTTVTLYFPATREVLPAKLDANLDTADSLMGRGETILVVDDVPEQRELVSAMLSRLNYKVAAVASGEAAIAYLQEHPVDLMILDMIMAPGMDGLETYRSVVERHPGQKAIIASGYSETERVRTAQRLGAGQYIKKPYTLEKIGLAVRLELMAPSRG